MSLRLLFSDIKISTVGFVNIHFDKKLLQN